ncbi:MAG: hypothetical protein WBA74_12170 [Cyclobacteriaceae bacterium]
MTNLQEIVSRISKLSGAEFQELCDAILILDNNNYSLVSRTGSVIDKQETRVGTPDSFFLSKNGMYLFVESSSKKEGYLKKFKDDIEKCFDEEKTGISPSEIEEIILCFAYKLDTKEVEELRQFINSLSASTQLRIYGVDELSIKIAFKFSFLAQEYLAAEHTVNLPFVNYVGVITLGKLLSWIQIHPSLRFKKILRSRSYNIM